MKNKVRSLLILMAVFAAALSGCKISIGSSASENEVPMENIVSMAVDNAGTLYILSGSGLESYALSGDKKLDTVFDSQELAEAELKINNLGNNVAYSGFIPEKLIANGDGGLQFVGRYSANDAGLEEDMFVVQDISEMNYTAAYFNDIERDYAAGGPVLNGIGVTENGLYIRLNRAYTRRHALDGGVSCKYLGVTEAFPVPENVVGALETGDDGEIVHFLINDGDGCRLERDGETEAVFDRAPVADAFAQDGKVYAVYTDGIVTEYSVGGEEKEYADLRTGLAAGDVNDAFIWDGQLYWFDSEGVRTIKL